MSLLPVLRGELSALATRSLGRNVQIRAYHRTRRLAAAHNFTMPAMSPTMTEGNITSWKVKEGDSFSTGDVLLEIETDKASMDVEAQDDGIVAKIIASDGSKGMQVGARIAVLADVGDDISSLEIPAEEPVPASTANNQQVSQQSSPPKSAKEEPPTQSAKDQVGAKPKPPGQPQKQRYPLYPSVSQLFHENNLDPSEADKIPASGPSGRLLKGDVLAYLGMIDASEPSKISKHFDQLSHLDLSNIKIAEPRPSIQPSPGAAAAGQSSAPVERDARIALSISFNAIREVQKRVHDALGIDVPIATFITRAIELSNTDLPLSSRTPTADELFDDIIGIGHVPRMESHGHFIPQIVAVAPSLIGRTMQARNAPDIIDLLTGIAPKSRGRSGLVASAVNETTPSSIFALTVPKEEEMRAKVFLERMKTILQVDPGQLIV